MNMPCMVKVVGEDSAWLFEDDNLLSSMRVHLCEPLRRACKNGVCGICRCKLMSGQVDYGARQPFALWGEEVATGYILPCIARPLTDIELTEVSYEAKTRRRGRGVK